MADRPRTAGDPDPEAVFEALDDDACREILAALDEPMSASRVAEAAEVPVSTTYKKLDKLEEASLLAEETQLREGGHHRSRYLRDFGRLEVEVEDRQFVVDVERRLARPERRLVDVWSEIRRET